ncbi:hypothetical protein [Nonomuraea sp. NPDC050310]|uniref:hypothetical protein n=1 Tax=Nonomuraea sp. NPDC050310 TaxID=3154935 RepID=UPI0033E4D02B
MEWFFAPWAFMAYLGGPHGYEPPAPVDRWLIEIVYETAAAETRCTRCGAPLEHPRLRAGAWPVRVTARCRGAARHRHRADVSRTADGLHTNPLVRA